jgi:hypothetical protein
VKIAKICITRNTFQVKGTGLVANLVKSMLAGFNTNSSVYKMFSNEACLPKPERISEMQVFMKQINEHTKLNVSVSGSFIKYMDCMLLFCCCFTMVFS